MEERSIDFCEKLLVGLKSRDNVEALSREAVENFAQVPDLIIDTVDDALKSGVKGGSEGGGEDTKKTPAGGAVLDSWSHNVNLWYFIDKVCKLGGEAFVACVKAKLAQGLAQQGSPPKAAAVAEFGNFVEVLSSLRLQLPADGWIFSLVDRDLGLARTSKTSPVGGNNHRSAMALTVQSAQVRTLGAGFVKQASGGPKRESHQLQVRTVDSLMSLRTGGVYAPAAPAEIAVAQVAPDADAPTGYMQALPTGHEENYMNQRRKRLRDMFAVSQEDVDKETEAARNKKRGLGADGAAMTAEARAAAALIKDVVMPLELPRDDYGIKIGNYPEGVRFIREGIKRCGGALELDVVVQRIGTLADKETVREFGNIRDFIDIHQPTFAVEMERGKWVVRLRGEEHVRAQQESQGTFSWEEMQCPGCSRLLRGRNFEKHFNSRKCVGMQLSNGARGVADTPISALAHAAVTIQSKLERFLAYEAGAGGEEEEEEAEPQIDDDDLNWFAECIDRAADERRFKLAAPHHFHKVLRAIRCVRDFFVRRHGAAEMSDVVISVEDAAFANFFKVLGKNLKRLPIPWIETGDVVDMCRRFSETTKQAFPPPPRAGDPRVKMNNQFPGLLFAESDDDGDEEVSGDDDMWSDDEGEAFEFAPPVSIVESMMIAGRERDTKKLNYRLRTAPPMKLTKVLKQEGEATVQSAYSKIHQGGTEGQSSFSGTPAPAPAATHGGGGATGGQPNMFSGGGGNNGSNPVSVSF